MRLLSTDTNALHFYRAIKNHQFSEPILEFTESVPYVQNGYLTLAT